MNTSLNKIIGIFSILFLMPVVFFSVSEINSLNENERAIEEIYRNQLETILFSINQYSEDVVSNWANNINLILRKGGNGNENENEIYNFITDNASVQYVVLLKDNDLKEEIKLYAKEEDSLSTTSEIEQPFKNFLTEHKGLIQRLKRYKESGYRKIEPISDSPFEAEDLTSLFFILNEPYEGYSLCAVIVDSELFIQQVLSNKMESTAQDKFVIVASKEDALEEVHSSGEEEDIKWVQIKELWLLPGYYLSIALQSKSIQELVKDRSYTNLFFIIGVEVILFFAFWLIFKNIRKEVALAQQKSDFVSNVSHEIRTPLSLISLFAETLLMERVPTEEKKKEYYAIINQEAKRLAGIVNKILSFSRIEANKMKYEFQATDLNALVNETLIDYQYHLKNDGFTYGFDASPELDPVHLDKEIVKEALINLLDNAMKYSNGNKSIGIKTGKDGKFAFIEVKDSGIGISQKDQKYIFDKFYRVNSGLVHNTKGTGLGLTMVKQIMKAHNGNVSLESTLDKGSRFTLNFPLN